MRFQNFIPALVFLIIAVALMLANDLAEKPNFVKNMVGKSIPQFETEILNSKEKISDKEFTKKPSIINFWASWCIACVAEHKYLNQLKAEGYILYGVNSGDMPDDAAKYLKELGNPYHKIGYDPRRKLAVAFGTTGMPETFIVGTDGKITYHYRGALNEPLIEELKQAYAATK